MKKIIEGQNPLEKKYNTMIIKNKLEAIRGPEVVRGKKTVKKTGFPAKLKSYGKKLNTKVVDSKKIYNYYI